MGEIKPWLSVYKSAMMRVRKTGSKIAVLRLKTISKITTGVATGLLMARNSLLISPTPKEEISYER